MKEQIKELGEAYQGFKEAKGGELKLIADLIPRLNDLKPIDLEKIRKKLEDAKSHCEKVLTDKEADFSGTVMGLAGQKEALNNLNHNLSNLHQTIISLQIDETNKLIDQAKLAVIGEKIELLQKAWVIFGMGKSNRINTLITSLKKSQLKSNEIKDAETVCDTMLDMVESTFQKKIPRILRLHLKQIILILKNAIIPQLYKEISSPELSKQEELKKFFNNKIKPFLKKLSREENKEVFDDGSLDREVFSEIERTFNQMLEKNNLDGLREYYQTKKRWHDETHFPLQPVKEFLVLESTHSYLNTKFAIDLFNRFELLLNPLDPPLEQNIQNEPGLSTDIKPITLIYGKFKLNLTLPINEPTIDNVTNFLNKNYEFFKILLQGYDLYSMSSEIINGDDSKVAYGKIYIRKYHYALEYAVRSDEKTVNRSFISQDQLKDQLEEAEVNGYKDPLSKILKITSKKGHTLLQRLTKSRFLHHLIDIGAIKFRLINNPINSNQFTVTLVLHHDPKQEISAPDNFWFDASQVTIRQICHAYLGKQDFEESLQKLSGHSLSKYADFYVTNFLDLLSYPCLSFLPAALNQTPVYDLFSKITTALVYYCFDTDQADLLPQEVHKYSTISHVPMRSDDHTNFISFIRRLSSSKDEVTSESIAALIKEIEDDDLVLISAEEKFSTTHSLDDYFLTLVEIFERYSKLKWKPILFKYQNNFILHDKQRLIYNLNADLLKNLKFGSSEKPIILASNEIPGPVQKEIKSKSKNPGRFILKEFHDRLLLIYDFLIANKGLLGRYTVINLLTAHLTEVHKKVKFNEPEQISLLSCGFFKAIHAAERLPLDQRMAYYQNSLFTSSVKKVVKKVCSENDIKSNAIDIITDYLNPSYLTVYSSIPETILNEIVKVIEFKDDNNAIIHSCAAIFNELNIQTARGIMVGPDSLSKQEFPPEAKYIYFVLPPAIAVVIDRNESNIYCIGLENDVEKALLQLTPLTQSGGRFDGFKIEHLPIRTLAQQTDKVLCSAYVVSNIIGIITQLNPLDALSLNNQQPQQIIQMIKVSQVNLKSGKQPSAHDIQKWKNLMILMSLEPTEFQQKLQQLFYKEMVKNHNEQSCSFRTLA